MKVSLLLSRRMLLVSAVATVTVALVLPLGVIQPIKAEFARGATPGNAVNAFWLNISLNLLAALTFIFISLRSKGRNRASTSVLVIAGLMVAFLGFALTDAASAYLSHGPQMQTTSILLYICAVADLLAGVVVITTAFLRPNKN